MAKVGLCKGVTLRGARRVLTQKGASIRLTCRNGEIYTMKKVKCVQPNSDKQLKCRELLARANEMAREDMAKDGRREYWEKKAADCGYKTAIGCARAWYVKLQKEGEQREEHDAEVSGKVEDGKGELTKVWIGVKCGDKNHKGRRIGREKRRNHEKEMDGLAFVSRYLYICDN